jgi:3-oxoacyl-[acyl-carrier protein] reductase
MDLKIAGRVALVCGSSSGLGRAIAAALVEAGCRVALNARPCGGTPRRTLRRFRRT